MIAGRGWRHLRFHVSGAWNDTADLVRTGHQNRSVNRGCNRANTGRRQKVPEGSFTLSEDALVDWTQRNVRSLMVIYQSFSSKSFGENLLESRLGRCSKGNQRWTIRRDCEKASEEFVVVIALNHLMAIVQEQQGNLLFIMEGGRKPQSVRTIRMRGHTQLMNLDHDANITSPILRTRLCSMDRSA